MGGVKEHHLGDVHPVRFRNARELLCDDDRGQPDVPSVEGKFYQLAGSVFNRLGGRAVVQDYETVRSLCKPDDGFQSGFHFVMVAGHRERVRVFLVFPLLVGFVFQKCRAHEKHVVKMSPEIFLQHFQKVVCLFAGGHADDEHVKGC